MSGKAGLASVAQPWAGFLGHAAAPGEGGRYASIFLEMLAPYLQEQYGVPQSGYGPPPVHPPTGSKHVPQESLRGLSSQDESLGISHNQLQDPGEYTQPPFASHLLPPEQLAHCGALPQR